MGIRFREGPDSRELTYGSGGGGVTLRATAITSAGENEGQVWLWTLASTTPYYLGFIRNNIVVRPKGASHLFSVEVEYGTTGVGGGDQPLGGVGNDGGPPQNAAAPASEATPLTAGWSFSIQAPKLHLTQSRVTVSKTKRGDGVAPDFGRAVGVTADNKIEGVDWPPEPSFTFSRTVPRANVTLGYMDTLAAIAGRPNLANFYGFPPYSVILMQADGTYTEGEKWSLTYSFGVNLPESAIEICEGLEVPSKRGWDYLWVLYKEEWDAASQTNVVKPAAAYVEELIRAAPFNQLQIG